MDGVHIEDLAGFMALRVHRADSGLVNCGRLVGWS